MSDQSTSTRETVTSQVIDRSTRDPRFRQELLRNPKESVEQEMGVRVPANMEIRVVEETASTLYLVLPPRPAVAGQELSDRELEQVAGGWTQANSECPPCLPW